MLILIFRIRKASTFSEGGRSITLHWIIED